MDTMSSPETSDSPPQEEITRQLYAAFEPVQKTLRAALEQHPQFSVVCSGILENGPMIAWMSFTCERTDGQLQDAHLFMNCLLMRDADALCTIMRARVGWGRIAGEDDTEGIAIYEAVTPPIVYSDPSSIATLARHFPRLSRIFRQALHRGHPPSRLQTLWRQLFHDCPPPGFRRG